MSVASAVAQELDALIQWISGSATVVSRPYLAPGFEKNFDAAKAAFIGTYFKGMTEATMRAGGNGPLLDMKANPLFDASTLEATGWVTSAIAIVKAQKAAPSACLATYLEKHFAAKTPADQATAMNAVLQYLPPLLTENQGITDPLIKYSWDGVGCITSPNSAYTGRFDSKETVFCPGLFNTLVFSSPSDTKILSKTLIHEGLHRQNMTHFTGPLTGELYEDNPDYKTADLSDHLSAADSFAAFARDVAINCK